MKNAVAYLRTSSAANVGPDKDSATRQRLAVAEWADQNRVEIVQEFYDAAVSGADRLGDRPGFSELLRWTKAEAVTMVLVENASRFARDLIVQETGHEMLKGLGIELVAVDDPDAFTGDTPTANLIRQVLGAVAEFEKANLVSKLGGARDRKSAELGKRIEGRKGYDVTAPDMVREAKRLARKSPKTGKARTLEEISGELALAGWMTKNGTKFSAGQVKRLLAYERPAK